MEKKFTKKGFTLIETLVAIIVISIAVVAPMKLAGDSLVHAKYVQQSLTAAFLAEEGIEFIRHYRDSNSLYDRANWLQDIDANCATACVIDVWEYSIAPCVGCSLNRLYITPNGRYTHENGSGNNTLTPYTRIITVEDVRSEEVKVIVTVTWDHQGETYDFTLEDRMLHWQEL